jgi:uncharacterized protein YndB with AHSA1/START domain
MEIVKKALITVQVMVNAPAEKTWKCWTTPEHITHWNFASDDWHAPRAENDLQVGGKFSYRMEAKDGSLGFDFSGIFTKIEANKQLDYLLGDDRTVQVTFVAEGNKTIVTEVFEAEEMNSVELQQTGWQAILNNFKKYIEQ